MSPGPGPPMRIPAIPNSSRTRVSALPAGSAVSGRADDSAGRGSALAMRPCPTEPGRRARGRAPSGRLNGGRAAEVPQPANVRADRPPHGAVRAVMDPVRAAGRLDDGRQGGVVDVAD